MVDPFPCLTQQMMATRGLGRNIPLFSRTGTVLPCRTGYSGELKRKKRTKRASKPDSVRRLRGVAIIYLGRRLPVGSSTLPAASDRIDPRDGPPLTAYLGLLAVGFTLPRPSPAARCALTAPFHPYRRKCRKFPNRVRPL